MLRNVYVLITLLSCTPIPLSSWFKNMITTTRDTSSLFQHAVTASNRIFAAQQSEASHLTQQSKAKETAGGIRT